MIPTVMVSADVNPELPKIDPGNPTQDKVFLLSVQEFEKYRPGGAYFDGASQDDGWWLRTPGGNNLNAVYEGGLVGGMHSWGAPVTYRVGVRPALWIDLDS